MDALANGLAAAQKAVEQGVDAIKRDYLPMADKYIALAKKEWAEHVTDSEWAAALRRQLDIVEAEVRVLLTTQGAKLPGLANVVADPVMLQLAIYVSLSAPCWVQNCALTGHRTLIAPAPMALPLLRRRHSTLPCLVPTRRPSCCCPSRCWCCRCWPCAAGEANL